MKPAIKESSSDDDSDFDCNDNDDADDENDGDCSDDAAADAPAVRRPWRCARATLVLHRLARHLSSGWNVVDCSCLSLILYVTIAWLATGYARPDVRAAAAAVLLAAAKLLGFLRAFRPLAAFVALLAEVAKDCWPFMLILSIVLVGFGIAFDVLAEHEEFTSLPLSLYSTFMVSQGEYYLDDGGFPSSYGKFLQVLCIVIVVVFMMNLLIAVISDSYERSQEKEEAQFYYERALLIRDNNTVLDALGLWPEKPCRWLHVLEAKEAELNDETDDHVRKGIRQKLVSVMANLEQKLEANNKKQDADKNELVGKLAKLEANSARLEANNVKLEANNAKLEAKLDRMLQMLEKLQT